MFQIFLLQSQRGYGTISVKKKRVGWMEAKTKQHKLGKMLAYGASDILGGGVGQIISLYYLTFLMFVVQLSPLQAGLVTGIGRIWDGITDPLMGAGRPHKNKVRRLPVLDVDGRHPRICCVFHALALFWHPEQYGAVCLLRLHLYALKYRADHCADPL